jgi:drug/metabolite transporter (DMT)-like permease
MTWYSPDLWITMTIAAAFFQTLRYMFQKQLAARTLTAAGATFARFVYSAPLIAVLLGAYVWLSGQSLPRPPAQFWAFCLSGGVAQITATICVVRLFQMRNFAVGITLMKTEVILSVLVGIALLGEGVSWPGFGAIVLGVMGVLLLSAQPGATGRAGMFNSGMALGLASGALFAVSAVSYRGATLQVDALDPWLRAGTTLSAVTLMQMAGMALWLRWRQVGQITAVWRARRRAVWIGLLSMAGSIGWFTAFTLQTAAYVKALGQIELVLSLIASVLVFREKPSWRELAGMAILCGSIVMLVLLV